MAGFAVTLGEVGNWGFYAPLLGCGGGLVCGGCGGGTAGWCAGAVESVAFSRRDLRTSWSGCRSHIPYYIVCDEWDLGSGSGKHVAFNAARLSSDTVTLTVRATRSGLLPSNSMGWVLFLLYFVVMLSRSLGHTPPAQIQGLLIPG